MASNSPWGTIDSSEQITRGVRWVSTPSHGGLMVSKGAASKYLTPKAIELGGAWGDYICFEEDCAYAIAFFQNPQWKRHLDRQALAQWENSILESDSYMGKAKQDALARLIPDVAKTDDAIREDMRAIVAYWYPEFFRVSSVEVLTESLNRIAFAKTDNSTRLGFNYTLREVQDFESVASEQANTLRE